MLCIKHAQPIYMYLHLKLITFLTSESNFGAIKESFTTRNISGPGLGICKGNEVHGLEGIRKLGSCLWVPIKFGFE